MAYKGGTPSKNHHPKSSIFKITYFPPVEMLYTATLSPPKLTPDSRDDSPLSLQKYSLQPKAPLSVTEIPLKKS